MAPSAKSFFTSNSTNVLEIKTTFLFMVELVMAPAITPVSGRRFSRWICHGAPVWGIIYGKEKNPATFSFPQHPVKPTVLPMGEGSQASRDG